MIKTKNLIVNALLTLTVIASAAGCVPNSGIPLINSINVNPINDPGTNPSNPTDIDPVNPSDPSQNPSDPSSNNPVTPVNPLPPDNGPHPAPPDPQQPVDEDDFWTLMRRFGFFESKTKEQLTADIKRGVGLKVVKWSPGTVKDETKNMQAKFKTAAKYLNPAAKDAAEYLKRSLAMASRTQSIDFYLDVTYGPKSKKGEIVIQKVNAQTLEVLFYNKSGLITNYTQTPGSLLRLAHFMLIPPRVYRN